MKANSKPNPKRLPKTVFICHDGEGEDSYLCAAETLDSHAEQGSTKYVGRYELAEKMIVTTEVKAVTSR